MPPLEEAPSLPEIQSQINGLKPLLATNRYGEAASLLPYLIRDIDALDMEGRAVCSRILNITGWLFVQCANSSARSHRYGMSYAAEDRLDAAAAVATLAWMYPAPAS